ISSGVEKFLKFANNFGSLDYTFQNVQRTVGKFTSWAEKQQEPLPLSLADIASNLKNLYAYGQGKAVEIARNHLLDWAIQKDLSEKTGEPCSNAMVMNFFGVSGVGKSFLAQQIAELLQRKCLTISSSIVDKESSVSVIDQLFGAHKYRNPYGSESEEDPTIVDFVKRFPGSVIVIDEYDKVWTKQLDEVLRNIIDYGVVTIRNQKIDFSGTIIILTSNEKGPEKILASGEKQNHVDTTGSITYNVAHDKSFSNRVRWVPFVNLSFKEYIPILKDHIYERVTEYWEKVFGIKINIKNSVIEKMSKFVEKQNQGARPIDQQVIPSINHAIFEVAKEIGIDNIEKSKGKSISVEFDSSSGEASASAS
ncbi:MAG: AAA family ATPase, partial [Oscillospiraceae bacterium]|nr:AAA family ATPase [Oscillospiraceae bacterium]